MTRDDDTPTLSGGAPPEPVVELRPGSSVGRYVVLQSLGQGGMGIVYAAYDPRLDRKVALKLLRRRDRDPALEARLLREAQALAKLNDPHVLTLYDVGTVGEQIFLATEYVEGQDLSRWLKAAPRTTEEILDVFLQAGRGLSAAHRAGLVHRDFKPGNVMMRAEDGRVLVLDFGLARGVGLAESTPRPLDGRPETTRSGLGAHLTRAGSVLGTPAFMAPEQWDGREAGAAADQFGFCVALYLALYGELPFSPAERGQRPSDWAVRPAPEGTDVPAELRRVLVRGLHRDPEQRYPSMDALLRDLAADSSRRRRRLWVAAGLGTLILAGGLLWPRAERPCGGADERVAEVWNPSLRLQVDRAFAGTGRPYGNAATDAVAQILDGYARDWRDAYVDACEATHVRGDQSPQLLDRRIACLEQRRREVGALVRLFVAEPETTVERAVIAAEGLSPLAPCADAAALMSPVAPPTDPEERERLADLRRRLAENRALLATGRYELGLERATELARDAGSETYLPVVAETLVHLGRAQEHQSLAADAQSTLEQALAVAMVAHHDRAASEAFVRLVRISGFLRNDLETGDFYARLAAASLERLDRGEDLEADLADLMGVLELQRGRVEAAAEHHRRALEIKRRTLGEEHPSWARTLIRLSRVFREQGRFDAARASLLEVLRLQENRLGGDHPLVATTLDALGNVAFAQGRLDEAEAHHRRALEILRGVFGDRHPRVAATSVHLGSTLSRLGRPRVALELYEQALDIYRETDGPDHYNVGLAWSNIGSTREEMKEYEGALEAFETALEILERSVGEEHPWTALALFNLGEAHNNLGETREDPRSYERAVELHERALGVWRGIHGDDHYLVGHGLTGLGRALLGLDRRDQAARLFRRALDLWRDHEQDAAHPAFTHWMLARAIADDDPEGAIREARRAIELFRASDGEHGERVAEIEAWLRE